jgi:autotransporter translocation and assembly factor TamB
MKLQLSPTKIVFVLAFTAATIGISAFSQNDKEGKYSFRKDGETANNDTSTSGKHDRYLTEKDMEKIDAAMKKLDEQMEKLDGQIKKIDFSKVEREMNEALKKVDFERMNKQLEQSLKKIDVEKMNHDLKASLAKIDREQMKVHLDKVKVQIAKQKELHGEHMEEMKKHIDKSMAHVKESMLKVQVEIKNMQDFTDELQKDGLIDKKKNYQIEVKSGELYIDGNKQSKEVSDKYRKYYKKDNFSIIVNEEDGIRI